MYQQPELHELEAVCNKQETCSIECVPTQGEQMYTCVSLEKKNQSIDFWADSRYS